MDVRAVAVATQRAGVVAAVGLVPLVRWAPASDAFSLPKLLLLMVAASIIAAAALTNLVAALVGSGAGAPGGRASATWMRARRQPWLLAVGALGLTMAVAALLADHPVQALVGPYRRWNGLIGYGSVLTVALVIAARAAAGDVRWLVRAMALTGALAAIHGAFQWAGLVDQNLQATGSVVLANLGNSNFLSAYLAVTMPLVAFVAMATRETWMRVVGVVVVVAMLFSTYQTRAVQGQVAVLVAAAVAAAAWLWHRRRPVSLAVLGVLGIGGVLGLLGFASVGPLSRVGELRTLELRTYYWKAAVDMFADHPLFGVGPGRYIGWFRVSRPLEAAQELPPGLDVDAAHSVPLDMLAGAGILAFLFLICSVALALITALRLVRRRSDEGLTIALVAAWGAYLTQALVSLDNLALLLSGWVLAACLVALDRADREAEVAAASSGSRNKRKGQGRSRRTTRRALVAAQWVAGVGALVVAFVAVTAIRWLSADVALSRSLAARAAGQFALAAEWADDALAGPVDIPLYGLNRAEVHLANGEVDAGIDQYRAVLSQDGRSLRALLGYARANMDAEDLTVGVQAWRRVLDIEPHVAELFVEGAVAFAEAGATADAREAARRAVALGSRDPAVLAILG